MIRRKQRFIFYAFLCLFLSFFFIPQTVNAGLLDWFDFGKNTYEAVKAEQDAPNGIISDEARQWLEENGDENEREDFLDAYPDPELQKTINNQFTAQYKIEKIGKMTESAEDIVLSMPGAPYAQPMSPSFEETGGAGTIKFWKRIKTAVTFILDIFLVPKEEGKTVSQTKEQNTRLLSQFLGVEEQSDKDEQKTDSLKLIENDYFFLQLPKDWSEGERQIPASKEDSFFLSTSFRDSNGNYIDITVNNKDFIGEQSNGWWYTDKEFWTFHWQDDRLEFKNAEILKECKKGEVPGHPVALMEANVGIGNPRIKNCYEATKGFDIHVKTDHKDSSGRFYLGDQFYDYKIKLGNKEGEKKLDKEKLKAILLTFKPKALKTR